MPTKVDFVGDGFGDTIRSEPNGSSKPTIGIEQSKRASETVNGIPTFDPFSPIDGGTDTDSEPKRRGRPRGSRNQSRNVIEKTANNLNVDIAALLMSAHLMLASLTAPEMVLSLNEAQDIEKAIKELGKHYPIGLDPKKFAWIQLSFVLAQVYGTRAVAIYKRTMTAPVTSTPKETPKPSIPMDRPKTTSVSPPVQSPVMGRPLTPHEMLGQHPVPDESSL